MKNQVKLIDLQNKFVDSIYNKPNLEVLQFVKSSKISTQDLVGIYRNNLYSTLINALRITYPAVYGFLKQKKFEVICYDFIAENRSKSGNLDDYGSEFSDLLRKKNENFLCDLAKLEWLKHQAYLAKDSTLLDIEKLQKLKREKLLEVRFSLHPSCFFIESNYNLLAQKKQPKPHKKLHYFVVNRNDLDIEVEEIPKSEFNFLKGVKDNLTFYEIYEKYEIDIQLCLQKYVSNSVLSSWNY